MEALLIKQDIVFDDIVSEKFDTVMDNVTENNSELLTNSGSGSGGYAHNIFCYAAHKLFNINIDKIEFKPLRYCSLNILFYFCTTLI